MVFNPEVHHRRSIRLRNYDYSSAGAYFVTLCAFQRECLFGEVVAGQMRLNAAGRLVAAIWDSLPQRYQDLEVDAFVVMPNHIHGIVVIHSPVGANHESPGLESVNQVGAVFVGAIHELPLQVHESPLQDHELPLQDHELPLQDHELPLQVHESPLRNRRKMTLSKVVGYLKMNTAKRINQFRNNPGAPVWQRNYYERVIRDEQELDMIRQYIAGNPAKWEEDENHIP